MDPDTVQFFAKLRETDPENQKCFECAQKAMMASGGNGRCRAYFEEQQITKLPFQEKYTTRAAAHWRATVKALAEGTEPPPSLPPGVGATPEYSEASRDLEGPAATSSLSSPGGQGRSHRSVGAFGSEGDAAVDQNSWGGLAGTFAGIWGRAASAAQTAATTVTDHDSLRNLKSWVEDKGRAVATAVQAEQFWSNAQAKAVQGVSVMAGAVQTAAHQAENWLNTAIGEPETLPPLPRSSSTTSTGSNTMASPPQHGPPTQLPTNAASSSSSSSTRMD